MSEGGIHENALIEKGAKLGTEVTVGPFAIVGSQVTLGDRCVVEAGAQVLGLTEVGAETQIGRGAVIGGDPQDLGFETKTRSGVRIGRKNRLREHVTIHRATQEDGWTAIGDENFLMVGVHLGHDAQMGNANVLANNVLLAGHVRFGNRSVIGGGAVFHQFIRVGDACIVRGLSGISQDIPPYVMAAQRNRIVGLNRVGLRRQGFSKEEVSEIKSLFRIAYQETDAPFQKRLEIMIEKAHTDAGRAFATFFETPSHQGICMKR